ncbi:MAG: DUF357 domain-containing protein [Candidatus Aenigmarchaeota archaeon]|nr:DUF357 domain-containing protein [Candidatus Aenigmarchaeota archaeon]
MDLETSLKEETEKWLFKVKEEVASVRLLDQKRKDILTNINAYVKDSEYFLAKNDLIRAFEAVIWAWAILENSREFGALG